MRLINKEIHIPLGAKIFQYYAFLPVFDFRGRTPVGHSPSVSHRPTVATKTTCYCFYRRPKFMGMEKDSENEHNGLNFHLCALVSVCPLILRLFSL